MKRFRYALDPLCVTSCALYAANRWAIKPHCALPLFRFWFNDLLLIPCALPPLLQVHRWLKLRPSDAFPSLGEVAGHLVLWSVFFEAIGPQLMHRATGDPLDVVAYVVGGLLSYWLWTSMARRQVTT